MADTTEVTTRPETLAQELGVDGKRIRAFLRATYTDHPKRTEWHLTEDQANAVRERFTPSTDEDELDELED